MAKCLKPQPSDTHLDARFRLLFEYSLGLKYSSRGKGEGEEERRTKSWMGVNEG
jgi:hypothetical protein